MLKFKKDDVLVCNKGGDLNGIWYDVGDIVLYKRQYFDHKYIGFDVVHVDGKRGEEERPFTWGVSRKYLKNFTKIGTLN